MKKINFLTLLVLSFFLMSFNSTKAQDNVSICQNGDLAIRIEHQTYLCLSSGGQITGIGIPAKGFISYFNGRINSCGDKAVTYDLNSRIDRIGMESISYFNGNINEVGSSSISYFNGNVDKVGNQTISYFTGRVENIGKTSISYFNDKIDKIGDEIISYFNGRIDKIGAKTISYDFEGQVNGVDNDKFTYDADKNINHLDQEMILGIALNGYWVK